MFAAMISASLLPVIGWRGVAATGALPIVTSLLIAWIAPESVRWLLSRGRNADARREAAKLLGVPESQHHAAERGRARRDSPASMWELLQDQKRFWWVVVIWIGISTGTYGVILWGPTILSQLLKITAHEAAHYFVYASIASMLGRVLFSVLPLYIGRRGAAHGRNLDLGAGDAGDLRLLSRVHRGLVGVRAAGGLWRGVLQRLRSPTCRPMWSKCFRSRSAPARSGWRRPPTASARFSGPVCLALIAGSSDVVSPKATADAIAPAFLFLAACELAALIAIFAYRKEPHGKPMEIG